MKAPFVIIPELTAVAAAYQQANLIADQVLPRVFVGTEDFRYQKYSLAESFTVPETLVGRKSAPNQVEFTGTEVTDSTQDRGLDAPVPNKDSMQWAAARAAGQSRMPDPKLRATTQVTSLIHTAREARVAGLVFNPASYGTANKLTLSGSAQWSDYANSNPQTDITTALDSMIMRPNKAVFGRAAWSRVSQHPKIAAAVFKFGSTAGNVSRQAFADLFELEEVLVGDGWINTAARGQPAAMVRLWGKHCTFMHQNMQADTQFGVTFGFTAQFGEIIAGEIVDSDIGLSGGVRVRVGERVKELLTANDLGFGIFNCVA